MANLRSPSGGLAYGILVKEENRLLSWVFLNLPSITPEEIFTSGRLSEELMAFMHFMPRTLAPHWSRNLSPVL